VLWQENIVSEVHSEDRGSMDHYTASQRRRPPLEDGYVLFTNWNE
jgi:hypothetical protein